MKFWKDKVARKQDKGYVEKEDQKINRSCFYKLDVNPISEF